MTEKRFFVKDFCVYESENKIGMTLRDCCNRLNELSDENKELKQKLDEISELTELSGMIHLRKEEIKCIIER